MAVLFTYMEMSSCRYGVIESLGSKVWRMTATRCGERYGGVLEEDVLSTAFN